MAFVDIQKNKKTRLVYRLAAQLKTTKNNLKFMLHCPFQDNRSLHAEAARLAVDAQHCEEKEEKLVKDAVQHLTQVTTAVWQTQHY